MSKWTTAHFSIAIGKPRAPLRWLNQLSFLQSLDVVR